MTAPQLDMSVAASTPPTRYIPGDSGDVHVVLTNHGPSATHVPTRVTITMPADVTAAGPKAQPVGCVRDFATTVTCTAPAEAIPATVTSIRREEDLALVYQRADTQASAGAGTTSSWNVPFTVSPSAPENATLTGGTAILHQPADTNPANNEAD